MNRFAVLTFAAALCLTGLPAEAGKETKPHATGRMPAYEFLIEEDDGRKEADTAVVRTLAGIPVVLGDERWTRAHGGKPARKGKPGPTVSLTAFPSKDDDGAIILGLDVEAPWAPGTGQEGLAQDGRIAWSGTIVLADGRSMKADGGWLTISQTDGSVAISVLGRDYRVRVREDRSTKE